MKYRLDKGNHSIYCLKSTAGIAGSNAWGEAVYQCPSLNQEAPSVRAG